MCLASLKPIQGLCILLVGHFYATGKHSARFWNKSKLLLNWTILAYVSSWQGNVGAVQWSHGVLIPRWLRIVSGWVNLRLSLEVNHRVAFDLLDMGGWEPTPLVFDLALPPVILLQGNQSTKLIKYQCLCHLCSEKWQKVDTEVISLANWGTDFTV